MVDTIKELLLHFLYNVEGFSDLLPYQQSAIELIALTIGVMLLVIFIRTIYKVLFGWVK